jgi:hypothetical protein
MARVSTMERDNLTVSLLYPQLVSVDVPIHKSQLQNLQTTLNEQSKSDFYIDGYSQIRFFTKSYVEDIIMTSGFDLYNITETYENPASLYCIFATKTTNT